MSSQANGAERCPKMTRSLEELDLGGRRVRCRVHTWTAPVARQRQPIRFVGPDVNDPAQQLFLPEPLVQFWAVLNPNNECDENAKAKARKRLVKYFDGAFEIGYRLLAELAPIGASVPPRPVFELMKALFRSRESGLLAVDRRLDTPEEMVRTNPDGTMEVIIPGVSHGRHRTDANVSRSKNACDCLRDALREAGWSQSKGRLVERVRDVVRSWYLDDAVRRQRNSNDPHLEPAERLVWRAEVDNLWTAGSARGTQANSRNAIVNAVGGGMLAGEESLWGDLGLTVQNRALLLRFSDRLLRAIKKKRPDDFDRWLAAEREHGFRMLGPDFKDVERSVRQAVFRGLVWIAIQSVARCYAAFAFRAWIDFAMNHADGPPTPEASWLFQQQNYQHHAFAGLPLAFLSPGQLLWAWKPLRSLWESGAVEWAKYRPAVERLCAGEPITTELAPQEPEDVQGLDGTLYDVCTGLLGLYAFQVAERREADREAQAVNRGKPVENQLPEREEGAAVEQAEGRQVRGGMLEHAETADFDPSLPLDAPPIEDYVCPTCHEMYRRVARGQEQGNKRVARVECLCGTKVGTFTDHRAA